TGRQARARHLTFLFSSRRRHPGFSRDWSSDVCSSDLFDITPTAARVELLDRGRGKGRTLRYDPGPTSEAEQKYAFGIASATTTRSEERRVGTAARARGAGGHAKQQTSVHRNDSV